MLRHLDFDRFSFHTVFVLIAVVTLFFLIFPSLVIAIISFSSTEALKFPPPGFSFHLYQAGFFL